MIDLNKLPMDKQECMQWVEALRAQTDKQVLEQMNINTQLKGKIENLERLVSTLCYDGNTRTWYMSDQLAQLKNVYFLLPKEKSCPRS